MTLSASNFSVESECSQLIQSWSWTSKGISELRQQNGPDAMLALPTHLVELRGYREEEGSGGLPHPLPFPLLVRLRFLVFVFVFIFDSVLATVSIGQVRQSWLSRRGGTLWHSQVNAIGEYECVYVWACRCCGMWNDDKSFTRRTRANCVGDWTGKAAKRRAVRKGEQSRRARAVAGVGAGGSCVGHGGGAVGWPLAVTFTRTFDKDIAGKMTNASPERWMWIQMGERWHRVNLNCEWRMSTVNVNVNVNENVNVNVNANVYRT